MGLAPGVQFIGALLLTLNDSPQVAESLRTQGSVRIEDSAGMTVVGDPPLQLILSSGSVVWKSAGRSRSTGIETDVQELWDVPFVVEQSGFSSLMSGSGEVLSVSVRSNEDGLLGGRGPQLKLIIAQFN
jgi:hypothetical protein